MIDLSDEGGAMGGGGLESERRGPALFSAALPKGQTAPQACVEPVSTGRHRWIRELMRYVYPDCLCNECA